MIDVYYYGGLRPGPNQNRPPYDFTKYQQDGVESNKSDLDQDSNVDDAIGRDNHCTVTVVEQDGGLQGVDADGWHKQISDRSDVTSTAVDEPEAANENGIVDVNQLSRQQSCSAQPARNTMRLEYFKRRRAHLLSKQRKLKMLQHDLYDTLVKLQALLSEETSPHLEDKAARLTCLVAEVCAIQLQAQEIYRTGRHSTHSKQKAVQHRHEHKPAVQHNSVKLKDDREAAKDECLEDTAGHGFDMARMGELIVSALQSATRTQKPRMRATMEAIKSPEHGRGDMCGSAQRIEASEDFQQSRTHGKAIRTVQVYPAQLPTSWQGQEEQSRDVPAGSKAHAIGEAASITEEASSAGLACQPEATLGRWHRCDEETNDHKNLRQVSSSEHAADESHNGTLAYDGRCDQLLTMLRAELVLHGCHTGDQGTSHPQLHSASANARPDACPGEADRGSPIRRPGQMGLGSRLQQAGGAVLSSRPPVRAVQGGAVGLQQPEYGRGVVRVPRQAEWDSSVSTVVDPDRVVRTRSGLRLRPPARPALAAAAARPMSAYDWSNRPTTAASAARSERPGSRLGVVARCQSQGMQPWDQGSRGSRRPEWDDRFIVPEPQRQGKRQVENMAPVHAFRASTPDRVLNENLPKRKQQHPWLSKRARQLRGQQPLPRSGHAAPVPRPGTGGFGSLPSTSSHPRTAAGSLGSHENPYPGPGSRNQMSKAVSARPGGPAKEMLDSGIWPNGATPPEPALYAAHQQHPGLGLFDEAASQGHVEHIIGSHCGGASELGQQGERGGSLCDRPLKERLDLNLLHLEVQKQSEDVQSSAANAASGRLGAGSLLGGAVSAEPLLAQLEDMEARMKAMMSTIESRLYGIQGSQ